LDIQKWLSIFSSVLLQLLGALCRRRRFGHVVFGVQSAVQAEKTTELDPVEAAIDQTGIRVVAAKGEDGSSLLRFVAVRLAVLIYASKYARHYASSVLVWVRGDSYATPESIETIQTVERQNFARVFSKCHCSHKSLQHLSC
jgi:hypothetical protein